MHSRWKVQDEGVKMEDGCRRYIDRRCVHPYRCIERRRPFPRLTGCTGLSATGCVRRGSLRPRTMEVMTERPAMHTSRSRTEWPACKAGNLL